METLMSIRKLLPLLLSLVAFAGCGDKDESGETGHDEDHEDHDHD